MKGLKRKPTVDGGGKHQASKKGFKHKHKPSRGQAQSKAYWDGKIRIKGKATIILE